MKKHWIVMLVLAVFILTGCQQEPQLTRSVREAKPVEQIGQVPEEFRAIVENNVFYGVTAFDGRILKNTVDARDEENRTVRQQVCMMDLYGNQLAAYTCTTDDAYHVSTLTATADGGFLFVLGFSDYAYEQGVWASDKGFASRIIKCDKAGAVQFDAAFDSIEGAAFEYCLEKDGKFYFFGTIQTPERKTKGVYSSTDIYMVSLDQNGAVLKTKCIAGTDFDRLDGAEFLEQGFLLSVQSQSDDGDFAGSDSKGYGVDWVITVNDELEITKKKKGSGRDVFDTKVGEKDGLPIYKSDALLQGVNAGPVTAFIDYGDSYLVVSQNNTGEYENTPLMISSIWYYTETVYSLYDYSGNLIFRASVDSSPDYDSWVEEMNSAAIPAT